MASYTYDSLDTLRKQDLISIFLSLQSKLDEANNKVLEEVRNLSDTITKLSSELSITKNVNTLLLSRLVTLERQCWVNAQYLRRECLDIVDIPCEVSGEILEEPVNIFDKKACSISPDHIESCHRRICNCEVLSTKGLSTCLAGQKKICRNWKWKTLI